MVVGVEVGVDDGLGVVVDFGVGVGVAEGAGGEDGEQLVELQTPQYPGTSIWVQSAAVFDWPGAKLKIPILLLFSHPR